MSRRTNSRRAPWYAPLADVDPPLVEHVLGLLDGHEIAAYAEPLGGESGPYRDVRAPDRPTSRVFVDGAAVSRARGILDAALPPIRAEFLADAAARQDQDQLDQQEIDRAWADIVTGFGPAPEVTDEPLSSRLIRSARPVDDPDHGRHDAPSEAADDPTDHYVPPSPPPIPGPADRISRAAWTAVIGGPVLMILAWVLGLGSLLASVGVAAFIGGFITLVARMKDSRDDDGWDDGAVV